MDFLGSPHKKSRTGGSMESWACALKALTFAAIASCVVCTGTNSLTSDKDTVAKCSSEAASKLCLACATANVGIPEDACCAESATQRLCEDLLTGRGEESKRAKYFLGKRTRNNFLGKRLRNNFLGKRGDEAEELYSPGVEQADDKRDRKHFLGKRPMKHFLGKRGEEDVEESKRSRPFLGKRSVDDDAFLEDVYMGEEKRANPFLGKRRNKYFLGKRSEYDDGFDTEEKRTRYFLGKRDDLGHEDLDDLVKRAKYFLGKRMKYFLG